MSHLMQTHPDPLQDKSPNSPDQAGLRKTFCWALFTTKPQTIHMWAATKAQAPRKSTNMCVIFCRKVHNITLVLTSPFIPRYNLGSPINGFG
ncbi:hypothetical protein SLE2022_139560 [Rubroshorea leprosula]